MDKKNQIQNLFKYIKEISIETSKIVSNINNEIGHIFLKDIPINEYVSIKNFDNNDTPYLITIKKPENIDKSFPKVPDVLTDWIDINYKKLENKPTIKNKLEQLDSKGNVLKCVFFKDDNKRILAYENWIDKYNKWVENYNILSLFNMLYNIYIELQRDSEKIEVVLGQGVLQIKSKGIYYPIVFKRISLNYDLESNSIIINDTDTDIQIYTPLLKEIEDVNNIFIKELKEELKENQYDLLDNKEINPFLRKIANAINVDAVFEDNLSNENNLDNPIILFNNPLFLIKNKNIGSIKFIEEVIEDIEENHNITKIFENLIGQNTYNLNENIKNLSVSQNLAAVYGEDKEILLSKLANKEQLDIARKIETYSTILVQGPPGTGKTHTISNLIGHFLSQGKSILVTSHTKKALSVLKEKVVPELQDLCVSILDDNNSEMEKSINGIINTISSINTYELSEQMEKLKNEREKIITDLSDVREKIFSLKNKEYETIFISGKGYSVQEAAKYVNHNKDLLCMIPGKISLNKELPLSLTELKLLYELNNEISSQDQIEILNLININELMDINLFTKLIDDKEKLLNESKYIISNFNDFDIEIKDEKIKINNLDLYKNFDIETLNIIKSLIYIKNTDLLPWNIKALIDGKNGGGFKNIWIEFINSIEDTLNYSSEVVSDILGYQCILQDSIINEKNVNILKKIFKYINKGNKLNKLCLMFKKEWKQLITEITSTGQNLCTVSDYKKLISFMELKLKRDNLKKLYQELIEKNEGELFSNLGNNPEQSLRYLIEDLIFYSNWYSDLYEKIIGLLNNIGFNNVFINNKNISDPSLDIKTKYNFIYNDLDKIITLSKNIYYKIPNITNNFKVFKNKLTKYKNVNSDLYFRLIEAIDKEDIEAYKNIFDEICLLNFKYEKYLKMQNLLDKLEKDAPDWANEFKTKNINLTSCLESIEDAWRCKQFNAYIEQITSEPFEELQEKSEKLSAYLREKTSKLAEVSALYYLKQKIDTDISQQQALQGFKQTIKKIGKGTGKNAPKLKAEAKKLMAKCQNAVPVWIMPISKALESLNPKFNKFDIVIVDEASQANIEALPIIYLGKKIIVVGDDEQVSPTSMSMTSEKLDSLKEMYIKDIIPNYHLYDLETSLYDIMSQNAPTLVLKEHFRCVPEIIGYSNRLSYDYKIKPLRDDSEVYVKPSTISYRVNGARELNSRKNMIEAKNIVALILGCINQPEYENMTFGVVCLKGEEQVKLINQLLFEKIPHDEIDKRKILCGTASNFQGDERDVIFVSLVDSGNEGNTLMLQSIENKKLKQRYNVAISRAKNQIWVVHSLDASKDLKQGDIRRDLLEYIENPKNFINKQKEIEKKSDSPFEIAVANYLIKNGYEIVQQWEVGSYRIDMVAIYKNNKIAIECDGEAYHSGEDKIKKDMERQAILERVGWRFIRIRGSEYFKNPEATMKNVCEKLEEYGILKSESYSIKNDTPENDLQKRVKNYAAEILDSWKNINV